MVYMLVVAVPRWDPGSMEPGTGGIHSVHAGGGRAQEGTQDPWSQGQVGYMDPWSQGQVGYMDPWSQGQVYTWIHGARDRLDTWIHGARDRWDTWIHGARTGGIHGVHAAGGGNAQRKGIQSPWSQGLVGLHNVRVRTCWGWSIQDIPKD